MIVYYIDSGKITFDTAEEFNNTIIETKESGDNEREEDEYSMEQVGAGEYVHVDDRGYGLVLVTNQTDDGTMHLVDFGDNIYEWHHAFHVIIATQYEYYTIGSKAFVTQDYFDLEAGDVVEVVGIDRSAGYIDVCCEKDGFHHYIHDPAIDKVLKIIKR